MNRGILVFFYLVLAAPNVPGMIDGVLVSGIAFGFIVGIAFCTIVDLLFDR